MNFKFKLSRRLALIKAALVASAAHGQACDRTELTPRHPTPRALAAGTATPPPSLAVAVTREQDPNVPQNTLDNNLATRWSASGDGQWIRYDLGAVMAVGPVNIAWYLGTDWASGFDI